MMPLVIRLVDLARPGTTARLDVATDAMTGATWPAGEENDVLMELVDLWIVDTNVDTC